jgi:O-acetyl-ADP-ribose deacetylase (regulator of RNase III)
MGVAAVMPLPALIRLVDRWKPLTDAWAEVFAENDSIRVECGDFFSEPADALVSPANSFGIMDGGLDLAIRGQLGGDLQRRVHSVIVERHHGELPVGVAEVVATGNERWPYLVVAPTMRVPEPVGSTLNAYLAFRAALVAVRSFNDTAEAPIRSLVVPGLGTGIGGMEARRCAAQMRVAFDQVAGPARIPSFDTIHRIHGKLRSAV